MSEKIDFERLKEIKKFSKTNWDTSSDDVDYIVEVLTEMLGEMRHFLILKHPEEESNYQQVIDDYQKIVEIFK